MMARRVKHRFGKEWLPEEIQAFNKSSDRDFNLDVMLGQIEMTAQQVLYAAGLPLVFHGPYEPVDLVLKRLLEQRGFDWESKEGYAARIMYQTWLVRTAFPKPDAVAIHAMYLGELIAEVTMHEYWERGFAGHLGSVKGAERHWGSAEKRRADDDELRQLFKEQRSKTATNHEAYKAVARRADVSLRKVRRVITGY